MVSHKFKPGDRVVYTNPFGVCWGVRTITGQDERTGRPTYDISPTDTPWYSVSETNLTLADADDLLAHMYGAADYLQRKHGFTPTAEQLGGCG